MSDRAWMDYDIFSPVAPSFPWRVFAITNDNNDDGHPDGRTEEWTMDFPDKAAALKHCGVCRVGVSGIRVTVRLDGEEVR